MRHVRRIVSAAAHGLRRKIRAVRLNHHAIQRHVHSNLMQIHGALERYRTGKRNHAVHIHIDLCALPAGRTAMHHALRQPITMGAQDIDHIAVRVADMKDDRLVQLIGQIKLTGEHILLNVPGRKIVVIIQSDFAQRHNLLLGCEPVRQNRDIGICEILRVVRMHTDGGIEHGLAFGQLDGLGAGSHIRADTHGKHLRLAHARKHILAVGVKPTIVRMGMRVKQADQRRIIRQNLFAHISRSHSRLPYRNRRSAG